MSFKNFNLDVRVYQAPDCEAVELVSGAIICQSGDIEDWVYDENEI